MHLSRPELAVADPAAIAVLVALARADGPCAAADLARAAGVGVPAVAGALDALADDGVAVPAGDGHVLNRDHVLAMAVEQLAGAAGRLADRLRMHVALWDPAPAKAALTGSVARGDGGRDDDVDIVVARPGDAGRDPRWREQVEALRADVRAWTGNEAHVIEVDDEEALPRAGIPLTG